MALAVYKARPYDIFLLDLSNFSSLRETAAAINGRFYPSPGYRETSRQTWTEDDFDTAFASDYLSHWLLTVLLLQSMNRKTGRVVVVGGMVHE